MPPKPTSVRALQKKTGASYYSAYKAYKKNSSQEDCQREQKIKERLNALFREKKSCRGIVKILRAKKIAVDKNFVWRALKTFKVCNIPLRMKREVKCIAGIGRARITRVSQYWCRSSRLQSGEKA